MLVDMQRSDHVRHILRTPAGSTLIAFDIAPENLSRSDKAVMNAESTRNNNGPAVSDKIISDKFDRRY
jgi:hypothetical protein